MFGFKCTVVLLLSCTTGLLKLIVYSVLLCRYFAIPGKKLQNQDAEYNPHDQTQEAAYPEPVENSAHFEGRH